MKRQVLFIIHSMSCGGGAERVLANLINGLHSKGGYDISLLEIHHSDVAWEQLPEEVCVLPPVIDETAVGFWRRAKRWCDRRVLDRAPHVMRFFTRGSRRYDLVVAFNYLVPTYLVFEDEPSIAWNHGSIEELADRPRDRERLRKSLMSFERIVAIAKRTEESIYAIYPEYAAKVRLIYNGFQLSAVRDKALEDVGFNLAQPAIVAVGRLDENKNPLRILRAFARIHGRFPDAHLYYLGDGPLLQDVKLMVEEIGLADCVHLLGYVGNPYPYIKQATCLMSLSTSEGFQTVIVESLALGVPFISSPVGAAEELSGEGEYGYVLHDDRDVVDAFEWAHRVRFEDAAIDGRRAFVEKFSLDAQVRSFQALAEEVCGEGCARYE